MYEADVELKMLRPEFVAQMKEYADQIIGDKKVLGVLLRGTDIIIANYKGTFNPASIDDCIRIIDERVKEFYDSHKNEGITLTVKDLGYTYSNGCQVFEDAEIHAAPHEIVALVGPSGEGKTTMLRLLLSLLSPKEGNISLNAGDDCIPLTPSSRKLFSYVPQGNTMFSGTIAENMRNVKQDATDEEIINALKMSCAYDFVKKLPDTINSPLKERGGGLSEGQSQRLSIARALLRKSPILLLDEATSALDVATERRVLKNIMTDDYPRTCIVTTHRPTVLNICDRVYKISDKKCIVMSEDEVTAMIRG